MGPSRRRCSPPGAGLTGGLIAYLRLLTSTFPAAPPGGGRSMRPPTGGQQPLTLLSEPQWLPVLQRSSGRGETGAAVTPPSRRPSQPRRRARAPRAWRSRSSRRPARTWPQPRPGPSPRPCPLNPAPRRRPLPPPPRWYEAHSDEAWGDDKPTVMETRVHAKCLRSVASVRNYFREYRAKKKHEQGRVRAGLWWGWGGGGGTRRR